MLRVEFAKKSMNDLRTFGLIIFQSIWMIPVPHLLIDEILITKRLHPVNGLIKRPEVLILNCTSTGRKTGTVNKTTGFMVSISYNACVFFCFICSFIEFYLEVVGRRGKYFINHQRFRQVNWPQTKDENHHTYILTYSFSWIF